MELIKITKDKEITVEPCQESIVILGDNIGFLRFQPINKLTIELVQIYVSDKHRLEGWGSKLVRKFESLIKPPTKRIVVRSTALPEDGFGRFMDFMGYKPVKTEQNEYAWIKQI